uniref:P2X purinoceptor 4-like isoform X1 n=1 Tax=Petromyzon marinus TaxID=7757 RepID=A0AAJ7WM03_PETMA|nr:P2X purinoceptor 4-like isoform X1 [Petromyzon marinus]
MTNFIETPNQKQGACAENPDVAPCSSDTDCRAGVTDPEGEGVFTGLCVPINNTTKSCEVNAWCPLPKDSNPPKPAKMIAVENFTVLIKNNIQFNKFNFFKHNILGSNASYLKSCRYHRQSDPECPIFILGDIVSEAGEDFKELAIEGGVFSIMIEWNCNLDLNEQACKPNYKFRRLDKENRKKTISPGYNFRFPKYYKDAKGIETRTLVKAYGIRFMVEVIGQVSGKQQMGTPGAEAVEPIGYFTLPHRCPCVTCDLAGGHGSTCFSVLPGIHPLVTSRLQVQCANNDNIAASEIII